MGRVLDLTILVVDVESTCWATKEEQGSDEVQDIIEVGVTTLDMSKDIPVVGEKRSILIHPYSSKVNDFCTRLTTITSEMVSEEAIEAGTCYSFASACNILKKEYKGKDRVWASWGDFDRKIFEKQCQYYEVPYPFGPRHINLKCLFSVINHMPYELGMDSALKKLNIPLEGQHHRGHDDAYNIAKIAQIMFKK